MICAQTRSGRVRSEHKRNTRLTEDHSNMSPLAHQPISEAFIAVDKFERPKVTEWRGEQPLETKGRGVPLYGIHSMQGTVSE